MALTADDIIKILKAAKEMGLVEEATKPAHQELTKEEVSAITKAMSTPFDELSDEEIMYWATPHFDVLQADKEAKKKRLEEENSIREEEMKHG